MGQVLLFDTTFEDRRLSAESKLLEKQKAWTSRLCNVNRKSFIVRQMIQQHFMEAYGYNGVQATSLLPDSVVRMNRKNAQTEVRALSYTGGKQLPLVHGLWPIDRINRTNTEELFTRGKDGPTNQIMKGKAVSKTRELPTITVEDYDSDVDTWVERFSNEGSEIENESDTIPLKGKGYVTSVKPNHVQENTSVNRRITETRHNARSLIKSKSDTDMASQYARNNRLLARGKTTSNNFQTKRMSCPQIQMITNRNRSRKTSFAGIAYDPIKGNSKRFSEPNFKSNSLHEKPATLDPRFIALKRSLSCPDAMGIKMENDKEETTAKLDPFAMLSPSNQDRYKLPESEERVIRENYLPGVKGQRGAEKIRNAIVVAKAIEH